MRPSWSRRRAGAGHVAQVFKGRARGARRALINGEAGAVWAVRGRVRAAFLFKVTGDRVAELDLGMDPERLAGLRVTLLED